MDHQTKNMNGESHPSPPEEVLRGVGILGHDIAHLAELQLQLAMEDCRAFVQQVLKYVVIIVSALVLSLCSMVIVLYSFVELIVEHSDLSRGVAALCVGIGTMIISSIAGGISLKYLFTHKNGFARSHYELKQNWAWLKSIWKTPVRKSSVGRF